MTRSSAALPDILLVSPPVGNFAQVHPAICLLTAYVQAAGFRAVQKDISIDCFHHFHSRAYLMALKAREQSGIEADVLNQKLDHQAALKVSAKIRLVLLLDRVARDVEDAKTELRDPAILDRPDRLAAALRVLKDVGRSITAAHPGQHFNFQEFRIDGAFDDWESLQTALSDPNSNLMLPYLNSVDLVPAGCLGISVTYPDQLLPALAIARRWREMYPDSPIILGGSFVTRMAESFKTDIRWFELFDYLVLGDGEEALLALLRERGRPAKPEAIPNLCYRQATEIRRSNVTGRTSLGSLPVPMLEFQGIDLASYVAPFPVVALPISRGCYWGKCTFCNISNQAEEPYRVRPVDKVVADIKVLQDVMRTRYFDFCIDSYHPSGLAKLSKALIDAQVGIAWNAEVLLDPKFSNDCLAVMAESGCRHLRFGFESANSSTLEVMRKRNIREVIDRILDDCSALDIKVSLMSIIGFPTETAAEAWNTIGYYLAKSDKISFVTLHRFNVSAGSPIMHDPSLCGIEIDRVPGLLQPRYRYSNKNPQGMSPAEVRDLVPRLEEAILERYPQHAEIHTVGIGGWLTFLACCRHESSYFKQPIVVGSPGGDRRYGNSNAANVTFGFDVPAVESIARSGQVSGHIRLEPHSVMLSEDGRKITVVPGKLEQVHGV